LLMNDFAGTPAQCHLQSPPTRFSQNPSYMGPVVAKAVGGSSA
jgi:hypothetical protein